jgi:hypothetical protein
VLGLVAQELRRDLMPANETGVLAEVGKILALFLCHVINVGDVGLKYALWMRPTRSARTRSSSSAKAFTA